MPKPIIAVPADIRHFTGADWHAAQNQYVSAALKVAGVMSFIVPAFEDGNDVDAILDRQSRGLGKLGPRSDADSDQHEIGRNSAAAGERHHAALEPGCARAEAEAHAMILVQLLDEAA